MNYNPGSFQRVSFAILGVILALTGGTSHAQTTDAATSAANSSVVNMEKFSVSDVPVDQLILPTARPFSSLYGTDDNIMDVPRSVTIVSQQQMQDIDLQDMSDFSKLTTSAFTDSNFGSPANPTIRGQFADLFINGMRGTITENGYGAPFDFSYVESVNIVKGPATSVQGPSSYVGGFADMITKQPIFDKFRGTVDVTLGSYDTKRWGVDVGGPISPTLAYRLVYSGEDSDGFWYNYKRFDEQLYAALTWRPNGSYELAINAKALQERYTDNFGVNRATNLLTEDGLYQSGININNGAGNPPSDPENSKYVESGGNIIAWGPLVPVNYHVDVLVPNDHDNAHTYNFQAIQSWNRNSDFSVVNNTFFSWHEHTNNESYFYSEVVDPAWYIENRTELQFKLPKGSSITAGLAERFQHTLGYDDYFFEPVNAWDLSNAANLQYIRAKNSIEGFPGFDGVPVPGRPGYYGTPGVDNYDTSYSTEDSVSPFVQGSWKLPGNFTIDAGARVDFIHVKVGDPLTPGIGGTISVPDQSENVSIVYRETPYLSSYVTYNYSENWTGADAVGGGFWGLEQDSTGKFFIARDLFDEPSKLYEIGEKASLLNNTLFISMDVFDQTREQKPQTTPVITNRFTGFEAEMNFQPGKHFYATLGYSYTVASAPAGSFYLGYTTNQIPNGAPVDPTTYQMTGRVRVPGQPKDQVNALVSYTFDSGFGVEANSLWTGQMNNDYYGFVSIPAQYAIDASVFYKTKLWSYSIHATNITNQHEWTPTDGGVNGVFPLPGTQIFFTVRNKF